MSSLNPSSDRTAGERLGHTIFILVSLLFAIVFLMPIVWSVANSFKPAAEALANPVALFSKTFSLENYRRL